jgi:hypothetical protein
MTVINLMPEKLSRGNHVLWKAQVIAVLRGVQPGGFLDGTNKAPAEKITVKLQKGSNEEVPNPAYDLWKAQEQQVLSYLLTSVLCDVLV